MKRLLTILTCFALVSCAQVSTGKKENQIDPKAIALNDNAVELMMTFNEQSTLKAIDLLDEAIEIEPDYEIAIWNKYICHQTLDQRENALKTLIRIESLAANSPEPKMIMGIFYEKNGDSISGNKKFMEADKLYENILDTLKRDSKQYATTLSGRAYNLIFLGQEEKGRAIFQELYDNEQNESIKETYRLCLTLSRQELIEQQMNTK